MVTVLKHLITSSINWVFRRRSRALRVMRIGLGCLTLAFGAGWALDLSFPFQDGSIEVGFDSSGGTPFILVYGAGVFGLGLIGAGFIWEILSYREEQRLLARKKVIVVEARGLRDTGGTPLIEAVPPRLEGYRDQVLVDLRQRIKDGEIVKPEAALEDLISLPADLKRRENGFASRDVTLVYGGLTPVPFTFLTGVLIDDEGVAVIFDWDRYGEAWRELDGADDGKRFHLTNLDKVPGGAKEVALAVSVSYGVIADDVRAQFGDMSVVKLDLEAGSPDCHWSEGKQRALGKQFLDAAIGLANRDVRRIHLFLAAQNSVAFRFGRLYDKRNLPEVVVYQYQKNATPPYPWGVLMPVCGIDRPVILRG